MDSITSSDLLFHRIDVSELASASTEFVIVGLPVGSGLTWGSVQFITSLGV